MVSRKPNIVILSSSSGDFPGSVCYSGSKSYLMEATPLLEDKTNIVLVRAWVWRPFPPQDIGVSKITVNSGGIIEKMYVERKYSGMYIYTPLIIVAIYDKGWIEIDELKIYIPECLRMSKRRFYLNSRRVPPTAILLSGRLNDIVDWIKGEGSGINIEYKYVYEGEKYRITALRFSSKNVNHIDILAKDLDEKICSKFLIPASQENGIFNTNAVLLLAEREKNILDIGGYRIKV